MNFTKIQINKYFKLLYIVFFSNLLFCQNGKENKFFKQIQDKQDTINIKLLMDKAEDIYYSFPDSSYAYYLKSLKISKNINSKKFEALSLLNIGYYFDDKGLYKESLEYYLKAIEISKLINNESGVADAYNYIGYSFAHLNSLDKSIEYNLKALDIYKRLNDSIGISNVYESLGNLNYSQKNYPKAYDYYLKSKSISENLNNDKNLLSSYINIGNVLGDQGDYDKSLEYYLKSLELSNKLNDQQGVAINYSNIGDTYLDKGDVTLALEYFNKSLKISEKQGFKYMYSVLYSNISKAYLKLEKYDLVIHYAQKSLSFTKGISWMDINFYNYEYLSIAYEKLGNYKKAYENHRLLKKTSDSIFNAKKFEQVAKLDILYELENQEKKITLLEEKEKIKTLQLKNQQLFNYALLVFSIFSIGFILSLIIQKKDRKSAYKLLMIEKNRAEESDRLKSSFLANMSHEIRTPMNAILGFSSFLNNPELTYEKRNQYVSIINNSANRLLVIINDIIDISKIESNQLKIDLKKFNIKKCLDELIEIQKESNELVLEKNLILNLKTPENAESFTLNTDQNRFEQILNNLINNAIKYTEKGTIEIGFNLEKISNKDYFVFYVKDMGCGIPKDKFNAIFDRFTQVNVSDYKTGNGLGLSICKGLLDLLGGEIWVESEENIGSTFYFKLPY